MEWVTKDDDKASQVQDDCGGGTLPLKSVECEIFKATLTVRLFLLEFYEFIIYCIFLC
jgi:hypothetical protein